MSALCLLLLPDMMSRTDLVQNGYNHNQDQEASNTAANDERQRVGLLIFQEDDSDLDREIVQQVSKLQARKSVHVILRSKR